MDPVTISILTAIFEGVLKAVPEAIAAYEALKQMAAEKRDPTAAEWQQMAGALAAVHNQVQAAAPAAGAAAQNG